MARRASFRPYVVKTPVELDIRFKSYRPAEVLSYLPIVKRTDAHSVRFVGKDMLEVSRFMEFVLTYQPSLEP
jgi:D-amino peptidase